MDLSETIAELLEEKKKLERVIASLEELASAMTVPRPRGRSRGRKSMGSAERLQVSARMKRYWAQRRAAN
jgi:hypothetical protein